MIDEHKLLEFLRKGQQHKNPLVGAIYDGLSQRIKDGQFNFDPLEDPETTYMDGVYYRAGKTNIYEEQ